MNRSDETHGEHWWIPIGLLALVLPVLLGFGILFPPDVYTSVLTAPIVLLGFVLTLFAPIAVYFDRKYVTAVSNWTPSEWYFLIVLPPFSLVLPYVYLYRRQRYVSKP